MIDKGRFYISVSTLCCSSKLKLEIMGIYRSTDHSASRSSLEEISAKVQRTELLIIMGGDFNLMRSEEDKNNNRINWARLDLFNDHIAD
jgi:hypothetical protein